MARERKERIYAVEVLSKAKHGKYGRNFYFGMYVGGYNKKHAEYGAFDILETYSINELEQYTVDKEKDYWRIVHVEDRNKPIGMEMAIKLFECKAYVEEGVTYERA